MAINPNTQYPGKIATPDANYPYGGAQNITVPGDGTGTPWEQALVNDLFGMQQALLKSAAIVPIGSADKVGASQYLQSIIELVSGRAVNYDETNITSNIYELTPKTNQQAPASYFKGMVVVFQNMIPSTGPSTIDVNGLGIKTIKLRNGNDTATLDIGANSITTLVYDGVNFVLDDLSRAKNIETTDAGFYYPTNNVEESLQYLAPETGTWTPTIEGITTPGAGWVFTQDEGEYYRVGNIMVLTFSIVATTVSGDAVGAISIKGMPLMLFTSALKSATGTISLITGVTLDIANDYYQMTMRQGSTDILIFEQISAAGGVFKSINISDMGATVQIKGSITVMV